MARTTPSVSASYTAKVYRVAMYWIGNAYVCLLSLGCKFVRVWPSTCSEVAHTCPAPPRPRGSYITPGEKRNAFGASTVQTGQLTSRSCTLVPRVHDSRHSYARNVLFLTADISSLPRVSPLAMHYASFK
ncbi:unnamed protein product [Lasius platythorax]|uniref:Uncharacterized protein n=1 Tax=Lasius platythorax TaxID=488582 RepID=A0AAV2P1F6_9HYME